MSDEGIAGGRASLVLRHSSPVLECCCLGAPFSCGRCWARGLSPGLGRMRNCRRSWSWSSWEASGAISFSSTAAQEGFGIAYVQGTLEGRSAMESSCGRRCTCMALYLSTIRLQSRSARIF